jgi:NAD(P)-dependent dehydrogenase (short-subunit alcohol dehydrogenase family)
MRKSEVVVITGASAGVGRATVRAFARRGARLGLLARGRDGLQAAAAEVEQLGGSALVLPVDVASAGQVEDAAARVEEAFGPIDVWVNNAMLSVFSPVREMKAEEYRRVTEVTYLGVVHGTLAALRRMLPRDRGAIVQVGSALAYRGIPLQSAYCAAKHAIQGFMDSLRCELIHDGSRVQVSCVHMPALNTPQFGWVKSRLPNKAQPVPPIFQPEVAAEAIVWAAHHERRELWVGFPTVKAILGDRIAPGLLDRYLAQNGYDAQQTDEPETPDRPHNLWEPLPGDPGAHGTFGDRAQGHSLQAWAARNRGWLAAAAAGIAAALLLAGRTGFTGFRGGASAGDGERGPSVVAM